MSKTAQRKKILLIVDNSPLVTGRLIDMLSDVENIEDIFTAVNYANAVKMLDEKMIDIVLLDILLPARTGIALLKFVTEQYPKCKIIIVSNEADFYYRKLCEDLGASFFIDKSKDFDQLPEIIASI